jgi:hypothetical protein
VAVASPSQPPVVTADTLRADETELRRLLPSAATDVVAVALQAMDNQSLLDPDLVAMLATPRVVPTLEAQRLRAVAKWDAWATDYADVLKQLRALIEKPTSQSAPESHQEPLSDQPQRLRPV